MSRLVRARRLPYEYYGLPFCQPETLETVAENLGEVLRGDKIMNSNYELKMGVEETCKILCRKELAAAEAREFATRCAAPHEPHRAAPRDHCARRQSSLQSSRARLRPTGAAWCARQD